MYPRANVWRWFLDRCLSRLTIVSIDHRGEKGLIDLEPIEIECDQLIIVLRSYVIVWDDIDMTGLFDVLGVEIENAFTCHRTCAKENPSWRRHNRDDHEFDLSAFCITIETLPMTRRIFFTARRPSSGTLTNESGLDEEIHNKVQTWYWFSSPPFVDDCIRCVTIRRFSDFEVYRCPTDKEQPSSPPEPVIRTISSLIDVFGAG